MKFSETVTADGGKMVNILFSNINVENKKMSVIFIFIVSNVKKIDSQMDFTLPTMQYRAKQ